MSGRIGFRIEKLEVSHDKNITDELFKQLLEVRDEEEKDRIISEIVKNNLKLVTWVLKRGYAVDKMCRNFKLDMDDFISVGYTGLYKAVISFDISKGYKFATYASMCINNEVRMLIRRFKKLATEASLDFTVSEGKDGRNELTLEDLIPSYDTMEEDIIFSTTLNDILRELPNILTKREYEIFMIRQTHQDLSHQEIADSIGMNQSSISRAIGRAKRKVLHLYETKYN